MDRNLALEFVRVTEAAAIAASKWIGRGEAKRADGAAVDEMRKRFNQIDFRGTIVIGEGSKDEAPELYAGEKVGQGWSSGFKKNEVFDLAVDPLECTDSVAFGRYNAMSVIASGSKGSLLSAPDTYMEKLAVGPKAVKAVKLGAPVKMNLEKTARALNKKVKDLTVCVLDRERHKDLILQIRKSGARVRLITDGDVAAAVATCLPESGIDMLLGIGASAESVLAGTAVKILGGQLFARFSPLKDSHKELLKNAGLKDSKVYSVSDLCKGRILTFTATGIIDGPLLEGIKTYNNAVVTHSIVIRGMSGTVRYITTYHNKKN
ncbi:MAG: class II fructose-bisphosphatase [Candidatus Doudnabacteria bacterium]|nr:class II fructose-bisphosphatase [Candidatus Doudnabacteria bacterium]